MTADARVLVAVSAYNSYETIGRCLEHLQAQTYTNTEIVVVDSHPDTRTEGLMQAFSNVRYIHHPTRLFPNDARNLAIGSSDAPLIWSVDPDAYAEPNTLEMIVQAFLQVQRPIMGAVTCYGNRWLDWGIHFCKFSHYLPHRPARDIVNCATVSAFFSREMYDSVGGFAKNLMRSDFEFALALAQKGLLFQTHPTATVAHHHTDTWRTFTRERYTRGREHAENRLDSAPMTKLTVFFWIVVTVLPIRLLRILWRTFGEAREARLGRVYVWALPVVAWGYIAWLAGEAVNYSNYLTKRTTKGYL